MKIVDYTAGLPKNLSVAVRDRIESGWQPYGSPFTSSGGYYAQAMVKYVEK